MEVEGSAGKYFRQKRRNWSWLATGAALEAGDTDGLPLVAQKSDGEEGSSEGDAV